MIDELADTDKVGFDDKRPYNYWLKKIYCLDSREDQSDNYPTAAIQKN